VVDQAGPVGGGVAGGEAGITDQVGAQALLQVLLRPRAAIRAAVEGQGLRVELEQPLATDQRRRGGSGGLCRRRRRGRDVWGPAGDVRGRPELCLPGGPRGVGSAREPGRHLVVVVDVIQVQVQVAVQVLLTVRVPVVGGLLVGEAGQPVLVLVRQRLTDLAGVDVGQQVCEVGDLVVLAVVVAVVEVLGWEQLLLVGVHWRLLVGVRVGVVPDAGRGCPACVGQTGGCVLGSVAEHRDAPHQGCGQLRRPGAGRVRAGVRAGAGGVVAGGVVAGAGRKQSVGGGQDLLGGPSAVGGLADGGDQGRPGGVGDDAGGEVVTEQRIEVAGPGRSQGGRGGGASGIEVAGLRGQGSRCQVAGQSPPQGGGGHLIGQRAPLVPRRCQPRPGLCYGGGVVARVADQAGDQGGDVDAGPVGGGELGWRGPTTPTAPGRRSAPARTGR